LPTVVGSVAGRVDRVDVAGRVDRVDVAGRVDRVDVAGRVDRVDVAGRVEGGWECPPVCLSRCVSHRPLGCIPCI